MKINKRIFVFALICIFLFTIGVAIYTYLSLFPKLDKVKCTSFPKLYNNEDCGYIKFLSGNVNKINGFILNKRINKNDYILDIITHNSKGKEILLKVKISEDPIIKYLVQIIPPAQFATGKKVSSTIIFKSSSEFFKTLNINDEVVIDIPILTNYEKKQAQNKFGELKELNCIEYQKSTLEYLKESRLVVLAKLKVAENITGCSLYTLSVEKINK